MATSAISLARLQVFVFLRDFADWATNEDVTKGAGVAPRTARAHTKALVDLGVLDEAKVSPGYRYRLSEKAKTRDQPYVLLLERAQEVFGM